MIALHRVFCGVVYKLVGKRFNLEIVRTYQVRVEACSGERHTERYRVI